MQQIEVPDYINERPRFGQKRTSNANQTEKRVGQILFLSFGMLCIIQATLNVSLRLTLNSSKESTQLDCNATHFSDKNQVKVVQDCEQRKPFHCNELQERFNALTRDKNLLENENNKLTNNLKRVEKERDSLKMMLRELSGCVSSQRCPINWTMIDSRCYFLSSERKTWEESRQYCRSEGADLVVINSEQEQRALYRLNGDADLLFWIGLKNTTETFKWVDGSVLEKAFWLPGQPDYGGPNNKEDCVEMYHHHPVLTSWNDAPCGHKLLFLCEREPH